MRSFVLKLEVVFKGHVDRLRLEVLGHVWTNISPEKRHMTIPDREVVVGVCYAGKTILVYGKTKYYLLSTKQNEELKVLGCARDFDLDLVVDGGTQSTQEKYIEVIFLKQPLDPF